MEFVPIFLVFLLGFTFTFFMLLQNQRGHNSLEKSFIKTLVRNYVHHFFVNFELQLQICFFYVDPIRTFGPFDGAIFAGGYGEGIEF